MTIPLWASCMFGNLAEVRAALASGEDVNGKDANRKKRTGLMWAVIGNHNSTVRLLLEQPTVELNCTDADGDTALHETSLYNNVEAVKLLLADPRLSTANHKNKHGWTPAMSALVNVNANVLRELVAHPSVDLNIGWPETSLEDYARWDFLQ